MPESSNVARRYAAGIFQLAQEENTIDTWRAELAIRFGVILQQIYIRYVRGQTHDERFRDMGDAVNSITQRGLEMIESGEI